MLSKSTLSEKTSCTTRNCVVYCLLRWHSTQLYW